MKSEPHQIYNLQLDVLEEHPGWAQSSVLTLDIVRQIVHATLKHTEYSCQGTSLVLSVLLADDATLQELNRDFLGLDKPTNVLAFPVGEQNGTDYYLGDIALSYDTICMEAQLYNKTIHQRAVHMLVHGVLHLLGYDHIDEDDKIIMEAAEEEILLIFGITEPYTL